MIKTIIIDDCRSSRLLLRKLITQNFKQLSLVGECENLEDAVHQIGEQSPELIILDIELGNATGFDLLKQFESPAFQVIFVSGSSEHAIPSYEFSLSAVDYLLKPPSLHALSAAVDKVTAKIDAHAERIREQLTFLQNMSNHMDHRKISITESDGVSFICLSDINRLEADGNYTAIICEDRTLVACRPLKEFEENLPTKMFCRIHQSHIVNLNKIARYVRTDGGYVVMSDGTMVEISRRRKAFFMNSLVY